MKTIYKITFVLISVFLFQSANSQDLNFTQILNHPLRLNPALISGSNDFRAILGHRAQWQSIEQGYQTESLEVIYPVFLKKETWKTGRGNARLDIGLSVINDRVGAFNTLNSMLTVSSGLKVTSSQFISVAVQGGYIYRMLGVDDLTFDEQYSYGSFNENNPTGETLINESAGSPDVGFGLAWFYVPMDENAKFNAYAGLSGFHLNEYNSSFLDLTGKMHSKFSLQGGIKILPQNWVDFSAHAGYTSQGEYDRFYTGLLCGFKLHETGKLVFGSWFKQKEAIALQLGYHHKYIIFDMSYDFPYSNISKTVMGLTTWEVSLGYRFDRIKKMKYSNLSFF